MDVNALITIAAKWLWDKYGKELTNKTTNLLGEKWNEFQWPEAAKKYCDRLQATCSTMHILGNPKPISMDKIYTDVFILDKPTAFRRFDIKELQEQHKDIDTYLCPEKKRKFTLSFVQKNKRLFILGKPGAGKTTFLKHLVLSAVEGEFPKTPIYISLREWADSKLELIDFIAQQFEICAFPDAKEFILHMLEKGSALVLFDGLDEVNLEENQRSNMIKSLTNFAKRYPDVHICLTCRIAATDYSFDQFIYIEIADFTEEQQNSFAKRWYQDNKKNQERFLTEFEKPENKGLRELAKTPLLLALLCLAFDETLTFPNRQVDLYKESIDALLKKWDSSRGIKRDEIYRKLSPSRKLQMLARIAANYFERGIYYFPQDNLETQIMDFLHQLPPDGDMDPTDGDVVLKAIEAQHGLLIERAFRIYSFSHLTFQEFLTAQYIVDHAADRTIENLIHNHAGDERWQEVFLMTASMLDNADTFFSFMLEEIRKTFHEETSCARIIRHLNEISKRIPEKETRYIIFLVLFFITWEESRFSTYFTMQGVETIVIGASIEKSIKISVHRYEFISRHVKMKPSIVSRVTILKLDTKEYDQIKKCKFSVTEKKIINRFYGLITNYLSCLKLASVTNREAITKQLDMIFEEE